MLKTLSRSQVLSKNRPVRILQFGEGNFLRAFADWIVDILNEKTDFNGNIQVVQPIPHGMGTQLNQQQGLYHVVLNGIQNKVQTREIRLITSVTEVINPFKDFGAYLRLAENPDLKFIISNTTESGIVFNPDDTQPESLPETFPGKLTTLLFHRYKHFKGSTESGVIFLPCELVEKNGLLLKAAVLQYADHWKLEDGFKKWILDRNIFCNTLVDRIVPGFPKDTIMDIQNETGYDDKLVVMAEPFHLWVIEGPEEIQHTFPAAKAGLEVKFVKDLTPYRTRKVRILNGAHTAMVPVAYLCGFRTVRESIEDGAVGKYVKDILFNEIIPTLDLPPSELQKFAEDVLERFQNPFIRHELASIALNSISKFKVRVLPSVLTYIEIRKSLPEKLLFSLAALIRFYKGSWNGEAIPVNDSSDITAFFTKVWKEESIEQVVQKTLSNQEFWGQDLTKIPGLTVSVTRHLQQIEQNERNLSKLI